MKSWKYFMMTTMVGSALALGACGDDAETTEEETPTEEVTTDTAEEDQKQFLKETFQEMDLVQLLQYRKHLLKNMQQYKKQLKLL